jgi:hypothetical protein
VYKEEIKRVAQHKISRVSARLSQKEKRENPKG